MTRLERVEHDMRTKWMLDISVMYTWKPEEAISLRWAFFFCFFHWQLGFGFTFSINCAVSGCWICTYRDVFVFGRNAMHSCGREHVCSIRVWDLASIFFNLFVLIRKVCSTESCLSARYPATRQLCFNGYSYLWNLFRHGTHQVWVMLNY